ncbi:MAG: YbhB/YbcL family Raf kinase inhibitor-like protein [Methanobacterium sp.]
MGPNLGNLSIRSPSFGYLEKIPKKYASDGENISPPLEWDNIPEDTKQLALLVFDPDAPYTNEFTHWVVYGIPPEVTGIAEGETNGNYMEGKNTEGEQGYSGPAPPPGHGLHHYYYWLYALDTAFDLEPGLTRRQLLDAIGDYILVQERYIGVYEMK